MSISLNEAFVALSIEVLLMKRDGPRYQRVLARLEKDYNLAMGNCFEHPEYLKVVLQKSYAKDYQKIVSDLESELEDLASENEIAPFLRSLR